MAGVQSGEGHTMIDSVVWVQVTNAQTDRNVAVANASPMYCIGQQQSYDPPTAKNKRRQFFINSFSSNDPVEFTAMVSSRLTT